MGTRASNNPETQFNRGAWLILIITLTIAIYTIAELAYRFSLAALYLKGEDQDKAIKTYREIIDLDRDGPKNLVARAALASGPASRQGALCNCG